MSFEIFPKKPIFKVTRDTTKNMDFNSWVKYSMEFYNCHEIGPTDSIKISIPKGYKDIAKEC